MPAKTWKSIESRLANWLNGKVPAVRKSKMYLGTNVEDISYGPFSIEVKSRSIFPKYIYEWFEQAKTNCEGRIPIIIWHEMGMKTGEEIVLIKLVDFKAYCESWDEEVNTNEQGNTTDKR